MTIELQYHAQQMGTETLDLDIEDRSLSLDLLWKHLINIYCIHACMTCI